MDIYQMNARFDIGPVENAEDKRVPSKYSHVCLCITINAPSVKHAIQPSTQII